METMHKYVAPSAYRISLEESANILSDLGGNGGSFIDYGWEQEVLRFYSETNWQ